MAVKATVEQTDKGLWIVVGEHVLAGPFKHNDQAWRWLDRHNNEAVSAHERRSQFGFDQSINVASKRKPWSKRRAAWRNHMAKEWNDFMQKGKKPKQR